MEGFVTLESSDEEEDVAIEGTVFASMFVGGGPFTKLLDSTVVGVDLGLLGEELLAKEWGEGHVIVRLLKALGTTDIVAEPFRTDEKESGPKVTVKTREVNSVMPVPHVPMCPKTTKTTNTYRICVDRRRGIRIIMEVSTVSHDVPYGKSFLTQERIELTQIEGSTVSIVKSCRAVFLSNVGFMRGAIDKGVMIGSIKTGESLLGLLANQRELQSPCT